MLTPRVSEELMRYQHGEHQCGAPRAQGAWTEPISDEILFVEVLTLLNFDAKVVLTGKRHAPLLLTAIRVHTGSKTQVLSGDSIGESIVNE